VFLNWWLEKRQDGSGGIRAWLDDNPMIVGIAAVVVTVVAIIAIFLNLGGGGGADTEPRQPIYYDVVAGTYFHAEPDQVIPPITSPQGNPAVRAYRFTCDGGQTVYATYFERYTEAAKQEIERQLQTQTEGYPEPFFETNHVQFWSFVSPPTYPWVNDQWVAANQPEALEKLDAIRTCPDGSPPDYMQELPE
jgi:hypothetical protein